MAITSAMNDTAKLVKKFLDDESLDLIRNYIISRKNPDGGFKGRDGRSDLYYTLFGLECSEVLDIKIDWVKLWQFLESFAKKDDLDFVHTVCLIRCINKIPDLQNKQEYINIQFQRTENFRSNEGYKLNLTDKYHSIYALFLAILAHEECQQDFPFNNDEILNILSKNQNQ